MGSLLRRDIMISHQSARLIELTSPASHDKATRELGWYPRPTEHFIQRAAQTYIDRRRAISSAASCFGGSRSDGSLEQVELVNHKTGEVIRLKCPAVFSFIGAVPRTDWLPAEIAKDAKGFVRTGPALAQSGDAELECPAHRGERRGCPAVQVHALRTPG